MLKAVYLLLIRSWPSGRSSWRPWPLSCCWSRRTKTPCTTAVTPGYSRLFEIQDDVYLPHVRSEHCGAAGDQAHRRDKYSIMGVSLLRQITCCIWRLCRCEQLVHIGAAAATRVIGQEQGGRFRLHQGTDGPAASAGIGLPGKSAVRTGVPQLLVISACWSSSCPWSWGTTFPVYPIIGGAYNLLLLAACMVVSEKAQFWGVQPPFDVCPACQDLSGGRCGRYSRCCKEPLLIT